MQDQSASSKITKKSLFAKKREEIFQREDFILHQAQQGRNQVNIVSSDHVWICCHKRFHTQQKSRLVLHDDGRSQALKNDGVRNNSSLNLRANRFQQ